MSLILRKHQQNVLDTVAALQARISEIETDIRMHAMANSTSDCELRLLHRLKDEYSSNFADMKASAKGSKQSRVRPKVCLTYLPEDGSALIISVR